MSASTEFAASLPFFGYQQRNALLDKFFYDTASLTVEEKAKLSPLVDREGSIIVVPPSNSDRQIRHYKRALRFMSKEGRTIRAIAVAGVGNSALGTAALARNVADALNTDVAGIVTGYGFSNMVTEALGGWFAFGAAGRIRHTMEKFFESLRTTMPAAIGPVGSAASSLPGDNDVATLSEILLAHPPELEYLVAHSKGSLVASYALQQYVEDLDGDESTLFDRLRITTLGAVVGLPPAFKNVKQYLGAFDWFGRANSRLGVEHERVPEAGHHFNPGFPGSMSVAALLKGGAQRLLPRPAKAEVSAPLAAAPKPMTADKPKEVAQSTAKKVAKPLSPTPKATPPATAAPKAANATPKVATTTPKVASEMPKVASLASKASAASKASTARKATRPAPKAAVPSPKPPIEERPVATAPAKPAPRPAAKKTEAALHHPIRSARPKTAAANGKLVVKTSKKGGR
jgi:hypothetical protein